MKYIICARFNFSVFLFILSACYCSKIIDEPNCSLKETCNDCIREFGCVWCNNDEKINIAETTNFHRCISEKKRDKNPNLCKNMVNPKQNGTIITNKPLTIGQHSGEPIQISPQKVRINLRRGEEYKLEFKYVQAKDYPVDLYYIIDNSYSMWQFKSKLSKLGNKLSDTMKKLTKHFRLGFGSFVEKTVMPFVNTIPERLKNPCAGSICAPPYTFKNHLSLTNDTYLFAKEVEDAKYSTNLDDPEGDLEALMQAIVCKEEIGWRENARHLLVLSTDSEYHIAGDGKLAGLVIPHDEKCHMENHTYTFGSVFDYPSISQINKKAIEHNINMIFAIVNRSETYQQYEQLKKQIKESDIGILSDDNSNIIDLITYYYNKITDSIKISDNSNNNIEVKYYSSCTGTKFVNTNQCDNLHIGVRVNFTAVIKLLKCPENGIRKHVFQIKPGSLNESLTVEIDLLCDCDCEKPGNPNYKEKAEECSGHGTLKCGVCDCDDDKIGTKCECDEKSISSSVKDKDNNCRPNNSSEICFGLGTCKCNKCVCQKRSNDKEEIYGKYCQCDNYSCKRFKGKVCSGESRGICDCGKCNCLAGYTGDACECLDNNSTCVNPSDNKICSGRGECKCGECHCKTVGGFIYSGQYCDECTTCPPRRCEEFQPCVQCLLFKTGRYNQNECQKFCTKYNIETVKKIDEGHLKPEEKFCELYDVVDRCYFKYKYSYGAFNTVSIIAQKEKVCTNVDIIAVVLFVIGSILIGGIIILLIWKGFTTIHDRREYAKFDYERKNAGWNKAENPLFKNASTNHANPMFSHDIDNN